MGRLSRCVLLIVLAGLVTSGFGQSVKLAKQEIQAQYDRWSVAYGKNDIAVLLQILAPEYVLKTISNATISRTKYEISLRLRKPDRTKYSAKILSIRLAKDKAFVRSAETMKSIVLNPKTKRRELQIHVHEYDDTWRKTEQGWVLSNTITVKEKTSTKPIR